MPVEGRRGGREDVEDDPSRPDIAAVVVVQLQDLGSDVVGGPDELVFLLEGQLFAHVALPLVGEAEVDYLQF